MAKMISHKFNQYDKFECYSERGILSYVVFRFLSSRPNLETFLSQIEFAIGCKNPFAHSNSISSVVLFSEFDFGKRYGFGCPDGAIFLQYENRSIMLFFEGKLNESYEKSCRGKRKSYSSTIQGQLELRWRAISLYKKYPDKALKKFKGEQYLIETEEYRKFYKNIDKFYKNNSKQTSNHLSAFRHLKLIEGVGRFFSDYVAKCTLDDIYFLTISQEDKNPFNKLPKNRLPRCPEHDWQDIKAKFCWLSASKVENYQES